MEKRVFVTGAASGIGKAIVEAFCMDGAKVAFCDVDVVKGNLLSKQTNARFFEADVKNEEALEHTMRVLFDEWGDIDVIVNNAGISEFSPITETTVAEFDKILATNLRPAFITSRLLAVHRSLQTEANP